MTCARWQQVKAILVKALDVESEADRLGFMAASCRDDPDLRAEIEALLAQDDSMRHGDIFVSDLKAALPPLLGAILESAPER